MKQFTTFILVLIAYTLPANAQQKAIIYPTIADYATGKGITADVTIEKRSGGSIAMVGGCDYKISSETDDALSKELKKNYMAVQRNDSLFINCDDILRSKWYGLAFYTNKDYVFFTASESFQKKHRRDMEYNMGGALGGIEAAGARYNYVIELATGEVYVVNKASMEKVLKDKPEILAQYKSNKYAPGTEAILNYLQLAFGGM